MAKENLITYDLSPLENYGYLDACPMGNGRIGAWVFGKTVIDKIIFNNDTVWSGKPKAYTSDKAYTAYKKSIEYIDKNDFKNAEDIIMRDFNGDWSQAYLPMCNLYAICPKGYADNYKRVLDMEHGVTTVTYDKCGTHFERIYFVSKENESFVCEYKSDKRESYEFFLESKLKYNISIVDNMLIIDGECPSHMYPAAHIEGDAITYGGGIKFTNVYKFVTDGECETNGTHFVVKNATNVQVYMYSETSFIDYKTEPVKECHNLCIEKASKTEDFEAILKQHKKYFSGVYNRTDFQCDTVSKQNVDIKKRISEDDDYVGKAVMYYNFAKYCIISSSEPGTMATNLQGIWNEDIPPIWSCSYTTNINLQMNYWGVLPSNLTEYNEPLIDLIKDLSEAGRQTAKGFYNADGWVVHQITDIWRMTNPSGGIYQPDSCCYAFWNGASGWLATHLFEHYEYTMDTEFLRETAYPIIKEAVKFYMSILKEYEGGLVITPSTSPENHFIYDGEVYSVSRYTAMSQAIAKDVMLMAIECTKILGIDIEFAEDVKEKCDRLLMFKEGSDGQLLEWNEEYIEKDIDYYHVSPLYALYPSNLINKNESFYNAAINLLKRRGLRTSSWPLTWQWALYDKIGDKEGVEKLLKYMTVRPDKPELMHVSGIFQMDCIYGNMACISNMFMISDEIGEIRIMPAKPDIFKSGHFYGLKAKGNIEVNIDWDENEIKITLQSPVSQTVKLTVFDCGQYNIKLDIDKMQELILKIS